MGMLAPALGRYVGHRALQNFQKSLLHAFPGHVAGNGGVFALAGDLIDLVDVNDAPLGKLHVVVGGLDQAQENILHVVAHVARLSQGSGVGNGKGDLQNAGKGLGKQSLAAACGAHQQNIAFLELHVVAAAEIDTLIVVIDRHRQRNLGVVLADHILVQDLSNLLGRGNDLRDVRDLRGVGHSASIRIFQDAHTQLDTFVTDIRAGPGNNTGHLLLVLSAE
ncbi:hypothetical protein SDC9_160513 [bioreactor metagenome]|uniref:Uncharacterized protein n=1 Tax=bioreactor metagenome TaxID=1076179 RepID=A0A645FLX4_9ZZZZ